MKELRFAAAGDNCIDRYVSKGVARVGGNALNVAVHFAKAGQASAYFGAVGDDEDGAWTRETLIANGVNADHLEIRPEITAYTDIGHTASGDRQFLFEEFGASGTYFPSAAAVAALSRVDHIHFGLLNGTDRLHGLDGALTTRSIDCAVNDASSPMDVAFSSAGEDVSPETELSRLLNRGHKLVVVTRGAKGAIASRGGEIWSEDAERIEPLDTTGAGDTFIANFLVHWKRYGDVATALRKGIGAATATCLHYGGFPQDDRMIGRSPHSSD